MGLMSAASSEQRYMLLCTADSSATQACWSWKSHETWCIYI